MIVELGQVHLYYFRCFDPLLLRQVSHPYLHVTLFLQTSNPQANCGFSVLHKELLSEWELNPGFSKSELDAVPPAMVGRANLIYSAKTRETGKSCSIYMKFREVKNIRVLPSSSVGKFRKSFRVLSVFGISLVEQSWALSRHIGGS